MLSLNALLWLKSINYESYNHENRMLLIKVAKVLYPEDSEDSFDNSEN